MKRFLWLLALLGIGGCISIGHADKLPYVVTVTDLGNNCMDGVVWEGHGLSGDHHKCQDWEDFKNYHLPGFQDCVSSSTAQCGYLQEIADDLNRAHDKGYEPPIMKNDCMYPNLCGSTTDANFDPDLQPAHPTKIICHKLVGGMMESVPCGPDAEIDRLNKQNKDLKDIVDQFGRGAR